MADIAEIGFSANTSELKDAKTDIKALVPPAKEAEKAAEKLGDTLSKVADEADKLTKAANGTAASNDKLAKAASGADAQLGDFSSHMVQYQNYLGRAVTGQKDFNSHVDLFRKQSDKASKGVKLMSSDILNLTRQSSDVGVTLAMGMSPFMVMIQQGPQIFDALQVAATRAGVGIGAVLKAMAAQAWAAMAPFMPFIIGVTAAVGLLAAAWGLATRSMNKDIGDNIEHLKLNEKQLERLKDKSVETGVTMGDTFKALGMTIKDVLVDKFGTQIDWLGDKWNAFLDLATKGMVGALKIWLGAWYATFNVASVLFKNLGSVVVDGAITAANGLISTITGGVNIAIGLINKLDQKATGGKNQMGAFSMQLLENPDAGAMSKMGADMGKAAKDGFLDAAKDVDKFGDAMLENAKKARDERVKAAAGKPGADKKDPKEKAKKWPKIDLPNAEFLNGLLYDEVQRQNKARADQAALEKKLAAEHAEFYKDMTNDVEGYLASANAEIATLGMSEQAAREYMYTQNLLNEAKARGVELTPDEIASLQAVYAEYTKAEIALRKTKEAIDFTRQTSQGFFDDMRHGLAEGKSLWETFGNAVANVLNKLADRLSDIAFDSLFEGKNGSGGGGINAIIKGVGGLFGGGSGGFGSGPNADGSMSLGSNVTKLAKGDVINGATLFKFAKGTGMMGEAGPEAIMPLTRGPNGSLGVQMYGNSGGGSGGGVQRVELIVRAEEGDMFRPTIETIADERSVIVTREGIRQYDNAMPTRVNEIANDSRGR